MCTDQFEICPVTKLPKGWCQPGHEAERDEARIARHRQQQEQEAQERAKQPTRLSDDEINRRLTARARAHFL